MQSAASHTFTNGLFLVFPGLLYSLLPPEKTFGNFLPEYLGIPLFNCLRLRFAFKQHMQFLSDIFFFLLQALID